MRWRMAVLAVLGLGPLLVLMGVGSYHLWVTGWSFVAWWPMFLSLLTAYGLAWRWTRTARHSLLPLTAPPEPLSYWTERDRAAWKIVQEQAAATRPLTAEQMTNAQRYADEAVELATKIAPLYSPGAKEPFHHLTLPEILTCAELVVGDLSRKVNTFVPGSHLFTIGHFHQAKHAIELGQAAWNLTWLARIVANPVNAGLQFLASKAGGSVLDRVQQNVLHWFHTAFIHELGRYLIELNSGRLKVGASRYRELMAAGRVPLPAETSLAAPGPTVAKSDAAPLPGSATTTDRVATDPSQAKVTAHPTPTASGIPPLPPVTVAIVGQVKAGKSSLVNALLGDQRAATDVVPMTLGATHYSLRSAGLPEMTLIDTAGYGQSVASDADLAAALGVAQAADVLILVAPARTAARQVDVQFLDQLQSEFSRLPNLKFPPVVMALTHADFVPPAMEWAPPYDWLRGTRPKEQNLREAAAAAREMLGDRVRAIVPVCLAPGREWNVREGLMELIAATMDDAHATALLRAFHTESRSGRSSRTVDQIIQGGREALSVLWQSLK